MQKQPGDSDTRLPGWRFIFNVAEFPVTLYTLTVCGYREGSCTCLCVWASQVPIQMVSCHNNAVMAAWNSSDHLGRPEVHSHVFRFQERLTLRHEDQVLRHYVECDAQIRVTQMALSTQLQLWRDSDDAGPWVGEPSVQFLLGHFKISAFLAYTPGYTKFT